MGSHWKQFEGALNSAAKNIGKEPRFQVIPDQRNTLYEIRYGNKWQSVDLSEAEQFLSDPSRLAEFVNQFLG
ncbi:MAG: hypothetical protein ACE5H2_00375 [Terriglobia bacterium]